MARPSDLRTWTHYELRAEIERLRAEHDDYVVRANANVCELNREIERLTAALRTANMTALKDTTP